MNETSVIIVIGSVKAKQYEPFRLPLVKSGMKPRVVRVDSDLFPLDVEQDDLDDLEVGKRFGLSGYELGIVEEDEEDPHESIAVSVYDLLREEITSMYGVDFDSIEVVVVGDDMSWMVNRGYVDFNRGCADVIFGEHPTIVAVN